MNIENKEYRPDYKKQVLALFKKTFQRQMSEEFWNWRFKKCPSGSPLIRLSFLNDQLVAMYLLQPINLIIDSELIKALFSMTTMTDPDFTGKGIMNKLANEVYDIAKKDNYPFVIGFANKISRNMFTTKLGFTEIVNMYEIELKITNELNLNPSYNCSKIDIFDESYLEFYQKTVNKKTWKFMVNRTPEYLNWRFIDHPENKYHCYKITKNNEILGYFVLKNYQGIKCHIIDFFISDDIMCYNCMVNQANVFCRDNNINKLTLWTNKTLPLYHYLSKIGFTANLMETFFIVKTLSNRSFSKIENYDLWYLTMGDSDVY